MGRAHLRAALLAAAVAFSGCAVGIVEDAPGQSGGEAVGADDVGDVDGNAQDGQGDRPDEKDADESDSLTPADDGNYDDEGSLQAPPSSDDSTQGSDADESAVPGDDESAVPTDDSDGQGADDAKGGAGAADDASDGESAADGGESEGGAGQAAGSKTLHVDGRFVLDTCGNRLVMRGVEQIFGLGVDVGGSWTNLVDEIASSGANALRMLPNVEQLTVADVDSIITRAISHQMVVFISPGRRDWFAQADVKAMLKKHEAWVVVDAFQEPNYDDRARWHDDALAAVQTVRGQGYTTPITVLANMFGRDLPSLFTFGADIVASDTLHNTILGWQAYWGDSGWYQGNYGMTLTQAVERVAQQGFPIQVGIDGFADANDPMDYVGTMTATQTQQVGWLWWDWYNPFGRRDNLSMDGTAKALTAFGQTVLVSAASGLKSAQKACRPSP